MKKTTIILLYSFVVFTGCKKESDAPTQEARTRTEILTSHTWQVKELISQLGNTQGRYVKGGINSTGSDYSKARLIFNSNGTGTSTDPLMHTWTMTWSFVPGDETKMTLVINYPTPATLNLAFVEIDETKFTYTIYYIESGQNALATAENIPL